MSGASREGAAFGRIFDRELDRLATLLEGYPDEASLWVVAGTTKNSAGTLALHIVGNLQHYIGGTLGGSGYLRDRAAEFGDREVPRAQLLARVAACRRVVPDVLAELDAEALDRPYPGELPNHTPMVSTRDFLVHLTWHLGWHLGQIDYHRRIAVAESG